MRRTLTLLVFLIAGTARAALVSGTLVSGPGQDAVVGAHVEVLETRQAITSDSLGRFVIAVPEAGGTLVVSCPGFAVLRLHLDRTTAEPLRLRLEPTVSVVDRIEVTANRAREGSDPATFTNLPQQRISEAHWGQDPAMLLSTLAPGMFAYNDSGNGIGYSYAWIRGFNQSQSRVSLNGAPLNDAESGELFFIDLADFLATAGDVQLQRGVFGVSGIGGAIDITTASPSLQPSFSIQQGFGSYRTRRTSVRYESGLIDGTWALTARYSRITTDGYRDQSWVDMWNYFLSLTRFGEHSRLRLVLFGGPEHTHLAYDGVPTSVLNGGLTGDADRDRRYNPLTYPGETDTFTQPHFQLIHEAALSPSTQLEQTLFVFTGSGYYDEHKEQSVLAEYDLPDIKLPDGGVITQTDLVRRRDVEEWDAGWVPTLTHTAGDWTFTARGDFRVHSGRHVGEVTWAQYYPVGVEPDHRYYDYQVDKRSAGLLLTASWRATDRLTLTTGFEGAQHRYELSHDKLKGVAFSESFNFALPRLGAVLRLSGGADVYANVARGMREPAFRTIYDPEDYYGQRVDLNPEDVWDWEAGVSVRRERFRARANLFWMSFANEIVYSGALDSSGVPIYANGARSRHRGVEVEASAQPTGAVSVDATLTLTHNTFTRFLEYIDPTTVNVYDGNVLAGFPSVLATVSPRASVGPVRVSLTGRYIGSFYLDNSEDNRQNPAARQQPGYQPLVNPAATVVDFAGQLQAPRWLTEPLGLSAGTLDLRINNLLDRHYTAFGYVDYPGPVFIPAATRNFYVSLTLGL